MTLNNQDMRDFVDTQTKPQNKSEFLSRFKSTREAAEFLHGNADIRNRKGEKVSVENLMRRFQGKQENRRSQGENKPEYREAGRELSPQIKNNELTVKVKGTQGQREREFEVTFKGADAKAFASDPSYQAFFYQYGYKPDTYKMFNGADGDSGTLVDVSIS